jgi:N6-adenosine-specific RNA methylase IME4
MKTNDPQARTIICDPPYPGMGTPYRPMSLKRILELPVGQLAAESATLLLWCPGSLMEFALAAGAHWGFQYHQTIVWWKGRPGRPTRYLMPSTEFLLYFTRGGEEARVRGQQTMIIAPSTDHSAKPLEAIAIARRVGRPKFLELFARSRPIDPSDDYLIWGDEVDSDIRVDGFVVPSDYTEEAA